MKNQQDNLGKDNMRQKNNIEQVLRDELQFEAEEIEKEIEAADIEDISEEQAAKIRKKLQERIAQYEMETSAELTDMIPRKAVYAKEAVCETSAELTDMDVYAKLSKEDREALELGRKVKEERRHVHKRRARKMYVALAAALILVLAIGMTSMGGPERIVSVVKQAIGGREVTQVDSDENNMVLESDDEEKAYQIIEETFGTRPVRFVRDIKGITFVRMDLDKNMQVAELLYSYNAKNMMYIISADYSGTSFGIDVEDKMIEEEEVYSSGHKMELTVYEIEENASEKCVAKFEYHGLEYFLVGTIEKEDFKVILENLYFL